MHPGLVQISFSAKIYLIISKQPVETCFLIPLKTTQFPDKFQVLRK